MSSEDLTSLYQQVILNHSREQHGFGLQTATGSRQPLGALTRSTPHAVMKARCKCMSDRPTDRLGSVNLTV